MRQLVQCRVVPAKRQARAASALRDQAPKQTRESRAQTRSRAASAKSAPPMPQPPSVPALTASGEEPQDDASGADKRQPHRATETRQDLGRQGRVMERQEDVVAEVEPAAAQPVGMGSAADVAPPDATRGEELGLADAEADAEIGAGCAETPAVDEALERPERDLEESGTSAHETHGDGNDTRGAGARIRARPAPTRLGSGRAPGRPGPLRGWLVPAPPRPEQAHRPTLAPRPAAQENGGAATEEGSAVRNTTTQEASAAEGGQQPHHNAQVPTRRETRSSTRAQGITWGQPRGPPHVPFNGPWIPEGRAPQAAQGGGRSAGRAARGGGRGARGDQGDRGAVAGGRGGRGTTGRARALLLGGEAAIERTGTWRERHDRPERTLEPANGGEAASDTSPNGSEFIPSGSDASEGISLGEEEEFRHDGGRGRGRRIGAGGIPQAANARAGPAEGEVTQPSEKSPADLANDESIWQLASTWDVAPLVRVDQPFLVRRMPPKVLEGYTMCLLAPLLRLAKHPDCKGAWTVLQFLPRLEALQTSTVRPALYPLRKPRHATSLMTLGSVQGPRG
ncbi:unnamed protein product [Closterium sp. NIES-64]|nr:unnamed protein product [Closterium sp. NIES-64]